MFRAHTVVGRDGHTPPRAAAGRGARAPPRGWPPVTSSRKLRWRCARRRTPSLHRMASASPTSSPSWTARRRGALVHLACRIRQRRHFPSAARTRLPTPLVTRRAPVGVRGGRRSSGCCPWPVAEPSQHHRRARGRDRSAGVVARWAADRVYGAPGVWHDWCATRDQEAPLPAQRRGLHRRRLLAGVHRHRRRARHRPAHERRMAPFRPRLVAGRHPARLHHHAPRRLGHRVGLGSVRPLRVRYCRSATLPHGFGARLRRASLVTRWPMGGVLRQRVPGHRLYPGLLPLARPGHWRHGAQRE